mmetsp:Transcript_26171/g.65065  ORF Transcript_26171/g.65065 Transcript_26171/m.65065 type:complete len:261 (+) Transcript_26171:719-1501(+)
MHLSHQTGAGWGEPQTTQSLNHSGGGDSKTIWPSPLYTTHTQLSLFRSLLPFNKSTDIDTPMRCALLYPQDQFINMHVSLSLSLCVCVDVSARKSSVSSSSARRTGRRNPMSHHRPSLMRRQAPRVAGETASSSKRYVNTHTPNRPDCLCVCPSVCPPACLSAAPFPFSPEAAHTRPAIHQSRRTQTMNLLSQAAFRLCREPFVIPAKRPVGPGPLAPVVNGRQAISIADSRRVARRHGSARKGHPRARRHDFHVARRRA